VARESGKLLTPERRIREAIKILGPTAQREYVEAVINGMPTSGTGSVRRLVGLIELTEIQKRNKAHRSKATKLFARQYESALRRVLSLTEKAPADFRWVVDARMLGQLKTLLHICVLWREAKPGKPKRDASDKTLAAKAAVHLLKVHNIKPKGWKLYQLAAVLHGAPDADLQKHCQKVLAGIGADPG
jgi:hypothetical protein